MKDIEANEWLTGVDDDTSEQVAANIEEAIELNGKKKIDSGGIMKLSEIVTTHEGEEEDNDDGLTEMERELQDALKMKQNRVGALDISDEENSEDEIDASKIESFTARIEKRQKEIQENEEMETENVEEGKSKIEEKSDKKPPKRKAEDHIDINQVMKKSKNVGRSDAEVVDIEDGTGETTTIREAFEDDDVIRFERILLKILM